MNTFNCLICHSLLNRVPIGIFDTRFGIQKLFSITKCQACGIEQITPLPSQEELNALYEQFYNFSGERNTRYTNIREYFIQSLLYGSWLAIDGDISFHACHGKGRLLDVGCNEGRGLALYRSNGFAVEGLELNSHAASVAREKGFTVHGKTLEELSSDVKYDVIVLSNVLEHSLNPEMMLNNIQHHLADKGEVWISCPNSRSWLRTIFGKYWINWHIPFHVVHFSGETLKTVLKKSQFEIVSIRYETPALWAAHSILSRLFAKPGVPTRQLRSAMWVASLMLLIRGLLFPLLWLGNLSKRGDCLVVVARKI